MDNRNNDLEKPFMEVVTNKMEKQEEKIAGIEEKLNTLKDNSSEFLQIKKDFHQLIATIRNIYFPTQEMRELSGNLVNTNALLKQPIDQKVLHHHYMDKALWVAAILLNVVVVLTVLLFNARDQIAANRESDVKYRHLKLSHDKSLRSTLKQTDSLYLADPEKLRKEVIREEDRRREQAALIQEALEKEDEARQLKEKAKKK